MTQLSPDTVAIPADLFSEVQACLDEGESLQDFVDMCVRRGVESRCRSAVITASPADGGISPDELLRRMDERLEAAELRLAVRRGR